MAEYNETASGGVVCGGDPSNQLTYQPPSAGGVVCGGAGTNNHILGTSSSGGVRCGGVARVYASQPSFCGCNPINEEASGGVRCGGSAAVDSTARSASGGVRCGGSAAVHCSTHPYDGLEAIWPLDETASPFLDRTDHNYDGTCTDPHCPTLTEGLFCSFGQRFSGWLDGREFVEFPSDSLDPPHQFSVSLWVKLSGPYEQRTIFSRNNFTLGHSVIKHIVASVVINADGDTISAYSSTRLTKDRFYHVGVSWDGSTLRIYIDGELAGSNSLTDYLHADVSSYAARKASGGFLNGSLQEIRVFPEAMSEAYFLAEHDNFCEYGFYEIGEWEALP
jgi:hypothetical protein